MTKSEIEYGAATSACAWKVPFRQVYCDGFWTWLRATAWCLVVIKAFPHAHDFACDPVDWYLEDPKAFFEQLKHRLVAVQDERRNH